MATIQGLGVRIAASLGAVAITTGLGVLNAPRVHAAADTPPANCKTLVTEPVDPLAKLTFTSQKSNGDGTWTLTYQYQPHDLGGAGTFSVLACAWTDNDKDSTFQASEPLFGRITTFPTITTPVAVAVTVAGKTGDQVCARADFQTQQGSNGGQGSNAVCIALTGGAAPTPAPTPAPVAPKPPSTGAGSVPGAAVLAIAGGGVLVLAGAAGSLRSRRRS